MMPRRSVRGFIVAVIVLSSMVFLQSGVGAGWQIRPGATPLGSGVAIDDEIQVCRDGAVFHAAMLIGTPDQYAYLPDFLGTEFILMFASPPPAQIPNTSPPAYDEPAPETIVARTQGITLPKAPIALETTPGFITNFIYSGYVWIRWSTMLDVGSQVLMRHDLEPGPWPDYLDDIYTVSDCTQFVPVDIRPGDPENTIVPGSNSLTLVAILSTAEFDATQANPSTICFGTVAEVGDCAAQQVRFRDIDRDSDVDMTLMFRTAQTGLSQTSTQSCISGETLSGILFHGCDEVRLVAQSRD